jgi:hypothetical protein
LSVALGAGQDKFPPKLPPNYVINATVTRHEVPSDHYLARRSTESDPCARISSAKIADAAQNSGSRNTGGEWRWCQFADAALNQTVQFPMALSAVLDDQWHHVPGFVSGKETELQNRV